MCTDPHSWSVKRPVGAKRGTGRIEVAEHRCRWICLLRKSFDAMVEAEAAFKADLKSC
jgi:hypothetical protein